MKCKREATLTNHGPFNDVRKLSATDNESPDLAVVAKTETKRAAWRSDPRTAAPLPQSEKRSQWIAERGTPMAASAFSTSFIMMRGPHR